MMLSSIHFCFCQVQAAHLSVPFHHSAHAADTAQALFHLLTESSLHNYCSDVELLAAIFAALCHDLNHPVLNALNHDVADWRMHHEFINRCFIFDRLSGPLQHVLQQF
jgi:hypothetical protein